MDGNEVMVWRAEGGGKGRVEVTEKSWYTRQSFQLVAHRETNLNFSQ